MNEKEFNKGIQDLKHISLTHDEKKAMLSHISAYADFHAPKQKSAQPSIWAFMYSRSSFAYSALGLLLVVSTTVYGAEKALPGDILYPFKIHINESLQSALISDVDKKAQWESEKFIERIEEAEILASQGKLDEARLREVEMRIDEHFEKIDKLSRTTDDTATLSEATSMTMQAKGAPAPEMARVANDVPEASMMMLGTFAVEDAPLEIEKDEFELEIEKHRAILQTMKTDNSEQNERIDRLDKKLSEKALKRAQKKSNAPVILPTEQILDDNPKSEIEVEIEDESDDDSSRNGANVFESQRGKGKNKDR